MNPRNAIPPDDWMDARVEAYVDGTLPPKEHARFEAACADAPRWKRQVEQARRIQTTLQATETPTCPPECTTAILDQTVRAEASAQASTEQSEPARAPSWLDRLTGALEVLTQPAYSTVAAALLVAVLAWLIAMPLTDGEPNGTTSTAEAPYSEEEIAQAQAEAEWALSYLSDKSQSATATAEREMNRALAPLFDDPEDLPASTP